MADINTQVLATKLILALVVSRVLSKVSTTSETVEGTDVTDIVSASLDMALAHKFDHS